MSDVPSVVLLFPGQGSQHPRMCAGLIGGDRMVRDGFLDALDAMGDIGRRATRTWLGQSGELDHVSCAQPLLFATGYAIGRAVLARGVVPAALLGHSGGELVAATLGGFFDLDAAARLLVDRVTAAADKAPAGGMLAVAAAAEDLLPHLHGCDVAAVNAPRQSMIAGTLEQLDAARASLREGGLTFVDVAATEPFHSEAMRQVAEVTVSAPRRTRPPVHPVYSGYTAEPMTLIDVDSGRFWADQVVKPVLFAAALERVLADLPPGPALVVEAGAGQVLSSFARRNPGVWERETQVVPLLPAKASEAEVAHVEAALSTILSLAGSAPVSV